MSERERFDAWLDGELHRLLNPVSERPAPAPRYSAGDRGRTWRHFRLASGAGAAFGAKAATGLVVAAFAAGATATAITGSANPAEWSTTVQQVVDTCRAGTTADGIGGCVAAVATQHGEAIASGAREDHPSPSATGSHPTTEPEASEHSRTPAPHSTAHPTPTPSKGHEGDHDPRPTPTPSNLHRPEPTHAPTPSDSD